MHHPKGRDLKGFQEWCTIHDICTIAFATAICENPGMVETHIEKLIGKMVYCPVLDAFLEVIRMDGQDEDPDQGRRVEIRRIMSADKGSFIVFETNLDHAVIASDSFPDFLARDYNDIRTNGGDEQEAQEIKELFSGSYFSYRPGEWPDV